MKGGRPPTPSLLLLVLLALALFTVPAAAKGGPAPSRVNVIVVVPPGYVSNATPAQAMTAVQSWLGSPSDAACIGSQYTCTMEGWFKHQLGKVFDYDLSLVQIGNLPSGLGRDACGSWSDSNLSFWVDGHVSTQTGIDFSSNRQRTMELVMGAGGWAGHFAPPNRNVDHMGMVGDWGVMEQYGVRNSCQLVDSPAHGFSHEFMGMMGAYVTSGYNEGGLFLGDVMSPNIRADLLKYSGKWLRNP